MQYNFKRKGSKMKETTTTPKFRAARTKGNFKVTAKATVFEVHEPTNTIIGDEEIVILDEKLYKGFYTAQAADYAARKDVEKSLVEGAGRLKGVTMDDVEVDVRPF
jgi:hypothetical protein